MLISDCADLTVHKGILISDYPYLDIPQEIHVVIVHIYIFIYLEIYIYIYIYIHIKPNLLPDWCDNPPCLWPTPWPTFPRTMTKRTPKASTPTQWDPCLQDWQILSSPHIVRIPVSTNPCVCGLAWIERRWKERRDLNNIFFVILTHSYIYIYICVYLNIYICM